MIEFLRNLPYKTYIGLFFCSLFASYWLVPRVTWLARGLGIFAYTQSEPERTHPSAGGLAVGLPFIAGISLLLLLRNQVTENIYMVPLQMRGLFFGSCLILTVGFLQDLLNFNRYLRIALQIAVAAVAYYYGFRLEMFPASESILSPLSTLFFTLLWVVGLINLFDLFNRRSHHFTSFVLVLTLSLLGVAYLLDQYRTIVVCCLLFGSLLGILSHDASLRPNLGSTGTFFIGFVLAVTTLQSHIVDGLYGLLLFALGMGLLVLLLILKVPIHLPRLPGSFRNPQLSLRSLHYFRQAFALKMKAATDPEDSWHLLCKAAQEFGYHRLTQRANTGDLLREWNEPGNAAGEESAFPLKYSGGWLLARGLPSAIDPARAERHAFFAAVVQSFDGRLEEAILTRVNQKEDNLRVLLVNRYFSGMSATGQIIEDLAEDLTQAGAAVTILTGGLSYENSTLLPGRNELIKDIHICRVSATHFGRSTPLNRTMDFIFFYLFSLMWVLKTPTHRYTHLVAFTDPPLIAAIGYIAKGLKSWKFVYGIQDLYPETALALGILKKGWGFRLCFRFSQALLQKADAIVTIGRKMSEHISTYVGSDKCIKVIPNWADGNKIQPVDRRQDTLRKKLKLKDVYTAIFAGNMGIAQEIDVLIELVKAFRGRQDIQFLFMGGGVRRSDLEEVVAKNRIENVRFLNYQARTDLSPYLGLADIGIVTLSSQLEGLAIPTKTYTYLAAGIPILAIASENSELKIFSEQDLGVHFASESIEKIVQFLDSEIKGGNRYRKNLIRSYFEAHLDRPCQTQKYLALLQALDSEATARERETVQSS